MTASVPTVLVFDFDGVILESAEIKTRAFCELFSAYPDHVDAIVAYHEANTGISRFKKFRHIYDHILAMPLTTRAEHKLGKRFAALVVEEVLRCPFVPGAFELLRACSCTHALFIASGTPEEELRRLVMARGLAGLFREVHGSPKTKDVILENILAVTRAPRTSVLFVGDGLSDYEAAKTAGVTFIGRVRPAGRNLFEPFGVPVVEDLFALGRMLEGRGTTHLAGSPGAFGRGGA